MKFNTIRIEPFDYQIEVPTTKLDEFNKHNKITEESFKKLGVPMDSFTFKHITGISISPSYHKVK